MKGGRLLGGSFSLLSVTRSLEGGRKVLVGGSGLSGVLGPELLFRW